MKNLEGIKRIKIFIKDIWDNIHKIEKFTRGYDIVKFVKDEKNSSGNC